MKFKVGDIVKFIGVTYKERTVPRYYCDDNCVGIEEEDIKHGHPEVGDNYFKDFAKITKIVGIYNLVEYEDKNKKMVILGFKDNVLVDGYGKSTNELIIFIRKIRKIIKN